MKISKRKVATLFVLTLLMTSLVFVQVSEGQINYAYIDPPEIYASFCEDFTVSVLVDVDFKITDFEFWVNFDPTQVSGVNVVVAIPWIVIGTFIGPNYVWARGNFPPTLGPGTVPLADITFHCDAPGTSELYFEFVWVLDDLGGTHYLPTEGATVNQFDLYWKPLDLEDYAPSGIPDFDQKQDAWTNPQTGKWSYCGPTAIANSLWWLDSFNEPDPIPPPKINDNFPLVWSYNPTGWDDHDPLNVGPLIEDLAWYMDTDGQRTGILHSGTKVMDMARGIDQYLLDHGLSDAFYQKTVPAPDFDYVEWELEKCEDVTLLLGFWQQDPTGMWYRVGGHYVTVAGIDSQGLWIAFSDPCVDNAEAGRPGVVRPGLHGYPHDPTVHNDTLFVSHDIYAAWVPGPGGSPGNPNFEVNYNEYEVDEWINLITNMEGQNTPGKFEGQTGPYNPLLPVFTEVEYAIIVSPWYAKPPQPDYAPSGVPDFDQRQDGIKYEWKNPYPPVGTWSYCGPTAVANSLWWLDSQFEPHPIPPPDINDGFPLVESYNPSDWDDHDPQNVPYLIEDLAYLMNTDNLQGLQGQEHCGTTPQEMEMGMNQYLREKDLDWKFYVHLEKEPDFYYIEEELERCQDVVLLLGFWQENPFEPGMWIRVGGHYVTVAGIDSTDLYIAFSDPFRDAAEFGGIIPGRVLPLGHGSRDHSGIPETLHNNASYVSHDIYHVYMPLPEERSPGGIWDIWDYYADEEGFIDNFGSCQNTPWEFIEFDGEYMPGVPMHTEIEYAIITSCETGRVAAGSEDGYVRVHDFYGNLMWNWGTEAYCVSVAFDNDARYLAGGWRYGEYGELNFFDVYAVNDGGWNSPLWTKNIPISESYDGGWMGKESKSVDVKYNSYNQYDVVAAATDWGLYLYDQWGNLIWQYMDEMPETIVRISQDGNYIVCADYNTGEVHYFSHLQDGVPGWGLGDGTPLWNFGAGGMEDMYAFWIAISGLGDYVAVSVYPVPVWLDTWETGVVVLNRTGEIVMFDILTKGGYVRVDMPCDGRSVVSVNDDPDDFFGCDLNYYSDGGDGWDLGDSTPVWSYWPGQESGFGQTPTHDFYTVAISENGDVIATGGTDGVSNVYVLGKDGTLLQTIGNGPTVQSVDLTFTGQYGIVGSSDGGYGMFDKDLGLIWGPAHAGAPIRSVAISKIYPCMFPFPDHDLAVTDLTSDKVFVAPEDIVNINATVTNEGDFTESFFDVFVEVLFNGMPQTGVSPSPATVTTLANGASTTISFTWDTTGFPAENYTLIAKASIVQDEIDVYDNTYVNGVIEVAAGLHDIAVTNLTSCYGSTIIAQNFTYTVNVTVTNEGDFPETFTLTLYWNTTNMINSTSVSLAVGETKVVQFQWNTTGYQRYVNYTLSAYATPVPGETDTADNTFVDPRTLLMTYPGDITGTGGWPDGKVDIRDIAKIAKLFGVIYPDPRYDPNCDLNCDGKIDIRDIATAAKNFGYVEP